MSYKRSNELPPYAKPRSDKPVEYRAITGAISRVTEKAVLVTRELYGGLKQEFWVPRSQINRGHATKVGDDGLMVSLWFLKKEGLVDKEAKSA